MADLLRENAVYGGPYLDESTALIAEANKEKPDFEALVADWETISHGALDYIETFDIPVETQTPVNPNFSDEIDRVIDEVAAEMHAEKQADPLADFGV